MWVAPLHLSGRAVRLEPLSLDHITPLWQVAEPALLQYIYPLKTWDVEAFQAYIQQIMRNDGWCSFAIVLQETNVPVGLTAYLDIRPVHRGLEIGSTWIAKPYQGGKVNPESKYLLLRHAFEQLGALRVQLKTDARNLQSQRAIAKLGAQREGRLRKHMRLPDGYVRDTVMFSIVDAEWPSIKARLEARLGYIP